MNKSQTAQRNIKSVYNNIIEVGYCDLYYLLWAKNADYYTAGVYGWNADIYICGWDICICTGYRPFGNIRPDRKTLEKYEKAAEKIIKSRKYTYETKQTKVIELLQEFIKITIEEANK